MGNRWGGIQVIAPSKTTHVFELMIEQRILMFAIKLHV